MPTGHFQNVFDTQFKFVLRKARDHTLCNSHSLRAILWSVNKARVHENVNYATRVFPYKPGAELTLKV